jgi:hypothetical protein
MRVVRLQGVALLLMLWRYVQNGVGATAAVRGPVAPPSSAGQVPSAQDVGGTSEAPIQPKTAPADRASMQIRLMAIFVATAALHLLLARTGWFFRYEAYLMAMAIAVMAVPFWEFLPNLWPLRPFGMAKAAGLTAVAVLLISSKLLWTAGYEAVRMTLPSMHDTYRWHYQMATFVERYYQGSALVIQDIGAVDYLADIHLTDPHGLADLEAARARLVGAGNIESAFLDQLARSRGATVAMVDEDWVEYSGGFMRSPVPQTWLLAGAWKYRDRVILPHSGLSFYGLDETAQRKLMENLRSYSGCLPADVRQVGPYTHPPH